jgi:Fe-S cluster biogenesis protein NfuA
MQKIREVIARKVLPVLQEHNGGIELLEVTPDGFVKVKLTGACSACPAAQQTITEVVEAALKEECPEIKGVIPVYQISDELINMALAMLRKGKNKNEA